MTAAWSPLATVTLGSNTPTITFGSIPQGYRDLILTVGNLKSTGSGTTLYAYFNGDTATNYEYLIVGGQGSTKLGVKSTTQPGIFFGAAQVGLPTTGACTATLQIFEYSSTNKLKSCLSRHDSVNEIDMASTRYRSTNPITSITAYITGGASYAAGTTLSLYGSNRL